MCANKRPALCPPAPQPPPSWAGKLEAPSSPMKRGFCFARASQPTNGAICFGVGTRAGRAVKLFVDTNGRWSSHSERSPRYGEQNCSASSPLRETKRRNFLADRGETLEQGEEPGQPGGPELPTRAWRSMGTGLLIQPRPE
jgi:hypothetical protein